MNKLINDIIKPKNGREQAICNDPEFIEGAMYGKPRGGHPEGAVIYHIREVLGNIDKFYSDDLDRDELRVIAIIHDSFKHKVDQTKPKFGDNHHAWIAERFALNYCHNTKVLTVIQLHDDAYNAWSAGGRHGDWYKAKRRAEKLINELNALDCLDLYVKFYRCDNLTGNKSQDNYDWFIDLVEQL
jgi:hypothetical protein